MDGSAHFQLLIYEIFNWILAEKEFILGLTQLKAAIN